MNVHQLKKGDVCQAACGAPARYVGGGQCLLVSSMCNELTPDKARLPTGGEEQFPLPSDAELDEEEARLANR